MKLQKKIPIVMPTKDIMLAEYMRKAESISQWRHSQAVYRKHQNIANYSNWCKPSTCLCANL